MDVYHCPLCTERVLRLFGAWHRVEVSLEGANFLELRTREVRRKPHRRTSGSVKLHSWVTALGQQGTEPDLRIYAVAHRCERIRAILQTHPQGTLRSRQFYSLGATLSQQSAKAYAE